MSRATIHCSGCGQEWRDECNCPALNRRIFALELEIDGLRALVKEIDVTLRVPAAEYVPAIRDVFDLIDKKPLRAPSERVTALMGVIEAAEAVRKQWSSCDLDFENPMEQLSQALAELKAAGGG